MDGKVEVMTTHQRIQEQHRRNVSSIVGEQARERTAQHVATSDLDQIKMALQALIDKVEGINQYVRSLTMRSEFAKRQPMTDSEHVMDAAHYTTGQTNLEFNKPIQPADVVIVPPETKLIEGEVDVNAGDGSGKNRSVNGKTL